MMAATVLFAMPHTRITQLFAFPGTEASFPAREISVYETVERFAGWAGFRFIVNV